MKERFSILIFAGGLGGMFLIAVLVQLFVKPETVFAIQLQVGLAILAGFFAATCLTNKYAQLVGWLVLTVGAGIRFSVFLSLVRGTGYQEPNPTMTIVFLMGWAFVMAWKGMRIPFKTETWRIAIAAIGQILVGVMAQALFLR